MAKGWRRRAAAAAQQAAGITAPGPLALAPTPFRTVLVGVNTAWHVAPLPTQHPQPLTLSIIFGTYNRLKQLQRCVAECRRSVGKLRYEFVICDGGSTDGSREWLAAQQDVILIGDRTLDGAVAAYNRAYLCTRGHFIALLNDDCVPLEGVLSEAVAMFQADASVGQVAISFDRIGRARLASRRGHPVASYSVVRAETARAVAAVCGGLWNPLYRTYAADWELSCVVYELGWKIAVFPRLGIIDLGHETKGDTLRVTNQSGLRRESNLFFVRWPRVGPPVLDAATVSRIATHSRVSPKQKAIVKLDPKPGKMPPREPAGPAERVLHLHLSSPGNGQESQVAALTALGTEGYISVPVLAKRVWSFTVKTAEQFQPSVIFVQIQEPGLPAKFFRELREAANNPSLVICNWSGDVGGHDAPNASALAWAIEAASEVDLTLWSSWTHVEVLRNAGVTAAYLQIGYDEGHFFEAQEELPPLFDVAFLYHEHSAKLRASLGLHDDCTARTEAAQALLKAFKRANVGATEPTLMGAGDAYRRTKLAISISASCTMERYTSDRLFRAMACTATAVKRFTGWESFGLKHEENCLLFDSTKELIELAKHWTAPEQATRLQAIRQAGAKLMREHHTWGVRIQELRPLIAAVRSAR